MRVIDLFCGCGGMSMGFGLAGHEVLAGFDNWDKAIDVYRANFDHPVNKMDLKEVDGAVESLRPYQPEMIIGGPPCQDFSSAGKRNEDGGRGDLTVCYAEIVSQLRPEWFVMENVARIVKTQKLVEAKERFRAAGYGLTQYVLDASLCGVPQARKRFVLIGKQGATDGFLLPYIEHKLAKKPLTVAEYFGDELDIQYYYRHPRSYVRRGIFSVDEPSPTIRGVNRPMPQGYPLHPGDPVQSLEGIRTLTTEERARIQTFPRDFKFLGCKTDKEQMIGNAVPVNLGRFVGEVIQDYINAHQAPAHPHNRIKPLPNVEEEAPMPLRSAPKPYRIEPQQLMMAFEPRALYYAIEKPTLLIGCCRQAQKPWIEKNMLYNYPITEEEMDKVPQLEKATHLIIRHRKTDLGYYRVKNFRIVSRAELKELDYPTSTSNHKASTRYILYSLTPLKKAVPQLTIKDCRILLGKAGRN